MFHANELRAELVRKELSVEDVAKQMGIDKASLYRKLKGDSEFLRIEIEKLVNILQLSGEDVLRIFFTN
jgi:transcriptional regulator with XRE-family HTH domain